MYISLQGASDHHSIVHFIMKLGMVRLTKMVHKCTLGGTIKHIMFQRLCILHHTYFLICVVCIECIFAPLWVLVGMLCSYGINPLEHVGAGTGAYILKGVNSYLAPLSDKQLENGVHPCVLKRFCLTHSCLTMTLVALRNIYNEDCAICDQSAVAV